MKVYKCDGIKFKGSVKCERHHECRSENDLPPNWITISGTIKNDLPDARSLVANGTYHFCSRMCLEYFLFKNEEREKELIILNRIKNLEETF